MTPRRALATIAVVLLVAVGSLQLLDPVLDERPAPEVDFSEPPAEVAADSAERFEHVDYAYRIDIADNRSGPWEQLSVVWVDRAHRRYRSVGPLGEDGTIIYGNDAVVFARPGDEAAWRVGYVPEATYPASSITQPFNTTVLRRGTVTMVRENSTEMIIESQTAPIKVIPAPSGHSRLHIDKQKEMVIRAVVEYDVGEDRKEFLRFRLVETGSTVDRPTRLDLTSTELFWDLLTGPVLRLE